MLLLLLLNMLSIDRVTNEKIVRMDSEDFPLFSRNAPLHLLLDVLAENVEADELLCSILRTQRENVSLVQYQSKSLFSKGTIPDEEPAGSLLCGFAFVFDRHTKSFAFSCNAYSSSQSSGISVSL